MQLVLVDPNDAVVQAWARHFGPWLGKGVEIFAGVIQDVHDIDALVTAGNSYGLMDGGVDLAVARMFPGVEAAVQFRIREEWYGELNVGAALLARLVSSRPAWLVYAPTMRVPMDIRGTDNVYRAFWGALVAVGEYNRLDSHRRGVIDSIAVPGLGTGAGKMAPDEAARQMALAWGFYQTQLSPCAAPTWSEATMRHHAIVGGACPDCEPRQGGR